MEKTNLALIAVAVASVAAIGAASLVPDDAMAQPSVTITPINDEISMQTTNVVLNVPSDNKLPWGFVTGNAAEHMPDYPVVIQFYQDGERVHVAQVDANADGSYEYKFRVLSVDLQTGHTTHVFEGEYDVSIFRVVPNTTAEQTSITGAV